MSPSDQTKTATAQYIREGASPSRPDTLLRAKPKGAAQGGGSVWDISRGQKFLARVQYHDGAIAFLMGHCNAEAAKDAIYIHDMEVLMAQRENAKRAQPVATLNPDRTARPVKVPQVIITLSPRGELQAELPAAGAVRRVVTMRDDEAVNSLRTILQAQLEGHIAIGEDGAPTAQQVKHWESHGASPDSRCRFCMAEGRITKSKRRLRRTIISKSKDVEIRRIAAKQPAKRSTGEPVKASIRHKNAKDLGL